MDKISKYLLTALALSISSTAAAEEEELTATGGEHYEQAEELMGGLSYRNGQFVPSHLTSPHLDDFLAIYNPNDLIEFLNGILPSIGWGSIEEWAADWGNTFEELAIQEFGYQDPALNYFVSLSPSEQADLYRTLLEQGLTTSDILNRAQAAGQLSPLLNALNPNEVTPALNSLGSLMGIDLSGLNLNGLNTAGKNLYLVNLSNTNITADQLSAASSIVSANLSGLDLSEFDTEGKILNSSNFSGTNITTDQLLSASDIIGITLSGTGITRATLQELGVSSHVLGSITF